MPERTFKPPATIRAEIGRTARRAKLSGDPGAPARLEVLRSEHAAARIADYITKVVAAAPPLSQYQLDRLATLLRPSAGGDSVAG